MSRVNAVSAAVAAALLTVVGLTGCGGDAGAPDDRPTSSSSSRPTPSDDPTATPGAEPSEEPGQPEQPQPEQPVEAAPLGAGCDEVLTPDDVYAFDPNFGRLDPYAPAAGSLGAEAAARQGAACRWVHLTNTDAAIELAAARLDAPGRDAIEQRVSAGATPTGEFGGSGYFRNADGVGTVTVFDGGLWLSLSSQYFLSASDAAPLVGAALDHLR